MVITLEGVHQSGETQGFTPGEQSFSEILWSLNVLQVADKELCCRNLRRHVFHVLGAIIRVNDDLVDLKESTSLSYLPDQVGLQLVRLGVVNDR